MTGLGNSVSAEEDGLRSFRENLFSLAAPYVLLPVIRLEFRGLPRRNQACYGRSMADRFMLNLGPALQEQVERVAQRSGVTKGEVVRHAVRVFLELERIVDEQGALHATAANGSVRELLPLTLSVRTHQPKRK